MSQPTRKWLIGSAGALLILVFALAQGAKSGFSWVLAFGLICGVLSMLPRWLTLSIGGLMGGLGMVSWYRSEQNSSDIGAVVDALIMAYGLGIGLATCIALLGGWLFDQFLLKHSEDDSVT